MLVRRVVREELQRLLAEQDGHGAPWMTVEQVAALLGITPNAVHQKLRNGWMKHARIKEGRRVLIERKALLAELQRKKGR